MRPQSIHTDLGVVLLLAAFTAVAVAPLVAGQILTSMDTATAYYPWYSFLGERLREGHLPLWNPHQFAGAPFAADPQSGWAYLPAMLLFAVLPLETAAAGFVLVHPFLASAASYALARTLGLTAAGGLLAATAYGFSGFVLITSATAFTFASAAVWLPLILLGAERALRSRGPAAQGAWWGVAGLGLSQVLAGWLGQGTYYVLLALVGYIGFRTLLPRPRSISEALLALARCALHLSGILVFGLAVGAAGLLPRLEYNALSNLAGGYPAELAGSWWTYAQWPVLLRPTEWYAGALTLALALAAPVVTRGQLATPYFAALTLAAFVLADPDATPLHRLLSLLPGFDRLHPHGPERIFVLFYLGPALLAGALVTRLGDRSWADRALVVLVVLGVLGLGATLLALPPASLLCLGAAAVLLALHAVRPLPRAPLGVFLTGLVLMDLLLAGQIPLARYGALDRLDGAQRLARVGLDAYYRPGGAVRFLQSQAGDEPFRFVGYGPRVAGRDVAYPRRWGHAGTAALEVNNRALFSGLQDVQGYNPVHLARYDQYLRALNGRSQNYHNADVFARGLTSPLLDLLNVRYLIVPAPNDQDSPELQRLRSSLPSVYRDGQAEVLVNPEALPRAWLVQDARQVAPGKALDLLASGRVDPRRTALLERAPPDLGQPGDPAADRARVVAYEPESLRVWTAAAGPRLLVLSEVFYPAWRAYVDGRPAPLYVANHLLRAVAVPGGEHVVDLRYESTLLWAGVVVSLIAMAAWAALAAGAWRSLPR